MLLKSYSSQICNKYLFSIFVPLLFSTCTCAENVYTNVGLRTGVYNTSNTSSDNSIYNSVSVGLEYESVIAKLTLASTEQLDDRSYLNTSIGKRFYFNNDYALEPLLGLDYKNSGAKPTVGLNLVTNIYDDIKFTIANKAVFENSNISYFVGVGFDVLFKVDDVSEFAWLREETSVEPSIISNPNQHESLSDLRKSTLKTNGELNRIDPNNISVDEHSAIYLSPLDYGNWDYITVFIDGKFWFEGSFYKGVVSIDKLFPKGNHEFKFKLVSEHNETKNTLSGSKKIFVKESKPLEIRLFKDRGLIGDFLNVKVL